jgi:hypothetical protein
MTSPYRLQDGSRLVLDKDGNIIKVARDDAQCIVPDGGRVLVPLMLMDSRSMEDTEPTFDASAHMPRTLPMTDAQKAQHAAQMKRNEMRMNDAWKRPVLPPLTAASALPALKVPPQDGTGMADSQAAYERRSKRLQDAWRHANIKVSP